MPTTPKSTVERISAEIDNLAALAKRGVSLVAKKAEAVEEEITHAKAIRKLTKERDDARAALAKMKAKQSAQGGAS